MQPVMKVTLLSHIFQYRSNKRRDWKNKKFGFGGQKKRSKGNTKESYNDSRDYSVSKNSKAPNRAAKGSRSKVSTGALQVPNAVLVMTNCDRVCMLYTVNILDEYLTSRNVKYHPKKGFGISVEYIN